MSILTHEFETVNPDEIDAPASEWPAWTDEFIWELSPEFKTIEEWEQPTADEEAEFHEWAAACEAKDHLQGDRLSLLELVARQADFYAGWESEAGAMIAEHLAELVTMLEVTSASTPAEHFARLEVLDHDYA